MASELTRRNLFKKSLAVVLPGLVADVASFRLKVTGEVNRPLALRYDEVLRLPSTTKDGLLICSGYFSNHGRWTGVHLKDLLKEAQPRPEAMFLDVKGHGQQMKIRLENIYTKKLLLA